MAEVGSVEVARDLEVCALRAANKRLAQELEILKSLGHPWPADSVIAYQHIPQQAAHVPVRQLYHALRVAPAAYYAGCITDSSPGPSRPGKWPCAKPLTITGSVTARAGYGLKCRPTAMRRPLAHPSRAQGPQPAGPIAALVCAPHRFGPRRARCSQPPARSSRPHGS